jgi:phosphomannomutase
MLEPVRHGISGFPTKPSMRGRTAMTAGVQPNSLGSRLVYEPQELEFGTSGRRGRVTDLTQLEVYINALAEVEYLQSLAPSAGGVVPADQFFFAYDLRPSSSGYVPEQEGRGEIAQAIAVAICDAGLQPINLGRIPTPALTYHALSRGKGSVMVTGSHIPFDRNGYKLNTSRGELLKQHEGPINENVRRVRARIYNQSFTESPFDERGFFKAGHMELPAESREARESYIGRYLSFFLDQSLGGKRLLVYEHSAVGRDILIEILERLGAEVVPGGRSDAFVPIDTENIDEDQLAVIQALVDQATAKHGPIHAVVSTDGDSDRPLILDVGREARKVRFFGGDLVGMIAAEYLGADAVVVPISCNDAIDLGSLAHVTEPKTRIGSPYVIAGMEKARSRGKRVICGWEANGGFLIGSDVERSGKLLKALPTRDAVLPILCTLFAAEAKGLSVGELFARLPRRFSRAALLKEFPRSIAHKILERFSPSDAEPQAANMRAIREKLQEFFTPEMGFGRIASLDYTDGVRVIFENGDVAHLRPSGNADEFRVYAAASTQDRAHAIASLATAEPGGILRKMEKALISGK